jgi:hypothetical protein
MSRTSSRLGVVLTALALAVTPLAPAAADQRPDRIALETGSLPEGIAAGPGSTFFVGARSDGDIFIGSARDSTVRRIVDETTPGAAAVGMFYDDRSGLLWVAGGGPASRGLGTVTAYRGSVEVFQRRPARRRLPVVETGGSNDHPRRPPTGFVRIDPAVFAGRHRTAECRRSPSGRSPLNAVGRTAPAEESMGIGPDTLLALGAIPRPLRGPDADVRWADIRSSGGDLLVLRLPLGWFLTCSCSAAATAPDGVAMTGVSRATASLLGPDGPSGPPRAGGGWPRPSSSTVRAAETAQNRTGPSRSRRPPVGERSGMPPVSGVMWPPEVTDASSQDAAVAARRGRHRPDATRPERRCMPVPRAPPRRAQLGRGGRPRPARRAVRAVECAGGRPGSTATVSCPPAPPWAEVRGDGRVVDCAGPWTGHPAGGPALPSECASAASADQLAVEDDRPRSRVRPTG